jgi:membrane protease YdiL (CAAX protease family)
MIPEVSPVLPPPVMDDVRRPFWSYGDVGMLILLSIPSLFLAFVVVRGIQTVAPKLLPGAAFGQLIGQILWYLLIFGFLRAIFHLKYNRPFWRSLGWRFPFRGMISALFAGPLLALGLGVVGFLLRAPPISLPFDQMLKGLPTTMLFFVFAVVIGPLCEELAFRGFLMPLLMRTLGPALGVLLTGVLFGCLHAPEYSYSWQHILIVTLAGIAFGYVRYQSDSTAASTLLHATFNLTEFVGFLSR